MANVTTSIQTNDRIAMNSPELVDFNSGLVATDTRFAWLTPPGSFFAEVNIHGFDLTYSGSGNARELSGGTIFAIAIDVGNDNGSDTFGDLVISGLSGINVSALDKDDPRGFWDEVLKGNDTFDVAGLSEAEIGNTTSIIFGDDLASAVGDQFAGAADDEGGNDTIEGADNEFQLAGDAYRVAGTSTPFTARFAEYDAGDDRITSALTDRNILMAGDAFEVAAFGILHGGNDVLDNSQATGESSTAVGEAYQQTGGTVLGGNDTITTSLDPFAIGTGDVNFFQGGSLVGGDDVIETATDRSSFLSGDVFSILDTATGAIEGGDDRITGSNVANSVDSVSGDVLFRPESGVSLLGGDDTIFGRAGNDIIYGEFGSGTAAGVSGGNDFLSGGNGEDQLFGQTGNDRLVGGADDDRLNGGSGSDNLRGGAGNDRLTGASGDDRLISEAGADVLIFGPGSGIDRVVDFTDENGVEDDRIAAQAYGFASVNEIGKTAAGNNSLVLDFGGGNRVVLINYLATHAIADINDDILI